LDCREENRLGNTQIARRHLARMKHRLAKEAAFAGSAVDTNKIPLIKIADNHYYNGELSHSHGD
jgi:hypothetical protein